MSVHIKRESAIAGCDEHDSDFDRELSRTAIVFQDFQFFFNCRPHLL